MKKLLGKFNSMKTVQKVEFVFASVITLVLVIGIPVYAWFSYLNSLETMTKVKEPDQLEIKAGNFDQILYFDLRDVNIEDMAKNNKSAYYVFSVSTGEYNFSYYLTLAHTTNIPFEYKLHNSIRSEEEVDGYVEYAPKDAPDDKTYYRIGDEIPLTPINPDNDGTSTYGRTLALTSGTDYDKTYDSGDDPQIYAVPLYKKTSAIDPYHLKSPDGHVYFVLELKLADTTEADNFRQWNKAENNKETDVIYITASRTTG